MSIRPKKLEKLKLRVDQQILEQYRKACVSVSELTGSHLPKPGSKDERQMLAFDLEKMLQARTRDAISLREMVVKSRKLKNSHADTLS